MGGKNTMRTFELIINDKERENETLSLLAYLQKYLSVEVREITSMEQKILEAKTQLSQDEGNALDEILPMFKNKLEHALNFLTSIRGKEPKYITREVNLLVREGVIDKESCKTPLWRALKKNGLYPRGRTNWLDQIEVPKTLTYLNADWKN